MKFDVTLIDLWRKDGIDVFDDRDHIKGLIIEIKCASLQLAKIK